MPYGDREIWSNEIEAHLMLNNNQLFISTACIISVFLHYYIKNLERNNKIIKPQRQSCFFCIFLYYIESEFHKVQILSTVHEIVE